MKELHFTNGNELITVKVDGKKIFATIPSINVHEFLIEKILFSKKFMTDKRMIIRMTNEYPEFRNLPNDELMDACKEKFLSIIDSLGSEDNIKTWVIDEMEKDGLRYIGRRCDEKKR